jgi:hypothetical protein
MRYKLKFGIAFFMPILCLFTTCVGLPNTSGEVTLDEAIEQSVRVIEAALPAGGKVAVLSFSSASNPLSAYVVEELMGTIVIGGKLVVVDRTSLDLIREEMDFQFSGDVSDESAQAIGRMLGAQAIVTGSFVSLGGSYRFSTANY